MNEIWKDIPNYQGIYKVSNLGRVKSFNKTKDGIILKQRNHVDGYKKVALYKNKKIKDCGVHKLVMLAFVGESDLKVDHINENPKDNRLVNLRYITHRSNISRSSKINRTSKYTGVSWRKKSKKWVSQIYINKKVCYLGVYNTELEASEAYQSALKTLLEGMQDPNEIEVVYYEIIEKQYYDNRFNKQMGRGKLIPRKRTN